MMALIAGTTPTTIAPVSHATKITSITWKKCEWMPRSMRQIWSQIMKIKVNYVESAAIAVWWFQPFGLDSLELYEWVDARDYCELHQGEITANCNNANCS
jgi:hypothetical protein